MLSILTSVDGRIQPTNDIVDGVWLNLVNPTESEIAIVRDALDVEPSFLVATLDEEETSRVETEGDQALIIIDVPSVETENQVAYTTIPLGIVVTESNIITVSLKETSVIREFQEGLQRGVDPAQKTRFIFTMLLKIATRYLQYLRQIDKMSNYVERQLYKSQRNKELIQLLSLEKSLLFFSTSLKANEATLEKIMRGRVLKLYDEDQDLLEDVLIEVRQAIEMANIYTSILSGTMDAYASVISNNLNVIMKTLTSLTILMTIPNIVFSFYGMNADWLPFANAWFPGILSVILIAVSWYVLKKKDLF